MDISNILNKTKLNIGPVNINNATFEQIAGDADTLAGLLLEIKGEFPALHEVISYKGYDFEVLKMDERRILKVKLTIHEEAADI